MTLEEFKAKCLAAIGEFHNPAQDGPLLVATREMSNYMLSAESWEEPFTEYAAAIGHWPAGYYSSTTAMEFEQFASDVITTLKRRAKELWLERQPEPAEDEPEADPHPGFVRLAQMGFSR